ncbi:MAG: hypothetical protein AAGE85_18885, partial [Pseudomonadota bacterium]
IQHHYMFNAAPYDGELRNPDWYVPFAADPVLDIYRIYDRILGQLQQQEPTKRLIIATGLHQDPHPEKTFYWRLRDHAAFLRKASVPFQAVEPLMSRDFIVRCADITETLEAERRLTSACASDGARLFSVDNRGDSLFVMLSYPGDINDITHYELDGIERFDLIEDVAFVAIKNGRHNGVGYLIDTGVRSIDAAKRMPLKELPQYIASGLGVTFSPSPPLKTGIQVAA